MPSAALQGWAQLGEAMQGVANQWQSSLFLPKEQASFFYVDRAFPGIAAQRRARLGYAMYGAAMLRKAMQTKDLIPGQSSGTKNY